MTTRQVNILTGNHGSAVQVEDILEYVRQGLISQDLRVSYSDVGYLTSGVNIILECNNADFNSSITQIRKRSPQSKLFIITSERLTPSGFNSANTATQKIKDEGDQDAGHWHYDNREYWEKRTQEFMDMLPVVDGLILNSEDSFIEYQKLGKPMYYLPLSHPNKPIRHEPNSNSVKDIDLLFTGTVTPYRESLIKKFESRGIKVWALGSASPDYLRKDYFRRAKISVGMNLSAEAELLSKYRAYYYLVHRIPHVFERAKLKTDLDPYINFAEPGDAFVQACIRLLSGRSTFPTHLFDDFANAKELNHQTIFSQLKTFLDTTHNLSLMEAA